MSIDEKISRLKAELGYCYDRKRRDYICRQIRQLQMIKRRNR